MEIKLNRNQIAIANAASKEPNRHMLQNVKLAGGEIVATDQYIIARHPVITEPDTQGILLSAESLLRLKPKKSTFDLTLNADADNPNVNVHTEKTTEILVQPALYIDDYPKLQPMYED